MFGLNKYVLYGIGAALILAVVTTYILMWKHSIRQQALLEANNKQLEQIVKDQKKFIEQMSAITKNQNEIIVTLNQKNEDITNKLKDLEIYLNSEPVNSSAKPSSEILKRTIKELSRKK